MTERGAALLALVAAVALLACAPAAAAPFQKEALPVHSGRLFDLGVADYDRDGRQELFTANHKYLASLLVREGGRWRDRLGALGLAATPAYPGFEDLLHPPAVDAPGLYIYGSSRAQGADGDVHDDSRLDVVAHDIGAIPLLAERARGTITVLSPNVRVTNRRGAEVEIRRDESTTPGRTIVEFEVAEAAHLEFSVKNVDLPPIIVSIEQAPLLNRTFVGARKVRAQSANFTLFLRDRHGWAWGDYDGDGRTDAFIARGGLGGRIRAFRNVLEDELMLGTGAGFTDTYAASGLRKGGCRSRRTQSGDFDGDGMLDLFSACKAASPKLYLGDGSGRFRGISLKLRRAGVGGIGYRWVDLRGDLRPELITAAKGRVRVYALEGRRVRRIQSLRTLNRSSQVEAITWGDLDNDGDPDLLIASRSGNTLLVNRRGRLAARDPRRLGLPRRSLTAAFVDWNLDGRVDVHTLPQGIYEQTRTGRFRATGLASSSRRHRWALASWFDYDNDGDRDLARALKIGTGVRVVTHLVRNVRGPRGHWLQVELRGPAGNSEGIGARVKLRTGKARRWAWIGESDDSRFSQGDYRVHFGLGRRSRVDRIVVTWPDGGKTRAGPFGADRRVVVTRG